MTWNVESCLFTFLLLHFGQINFFFSYSASAKIKENLPSHFSHMNSYTGIARLLFKKLGLVPYPHPLHMMFQLSLYENRCGERVRPCLYPASQSMVNHYWSNRSWLFIYTYFNNKDFSGIFKQIERQILSNGFNFFSGSFSIFNSYRAIWARDRSLVEEMFWRCSYWSNTEHVWLSSC